MRRKTQINEGLLINCALTSAKILAVGSGLAGTRATDHASLIVTFSILVGLGVADRLVPLLDWASAILADNISKIPRSLSTLTLPGLMLVLQPLLSAVTFGIVDLPQTAGMDSIRVAPLAHPCQREMVHSCHL